jgi:hypothetical protein
MAEAKEWKGGEVMFAGGTDWAMVCACLAVGKRKVLILL